MRKPVIQTSPLAPKTPPKISTVAGVRLATAQSGITYQRRDDLMLMCFDKGAAVAGVFTRSSTAAAPIAWCRQILNEKSKIKAILCNAGNANAFTGKEGGRSCKNLRQSRRRSRRMRRQSSHNHLNRRHRRKIAPRKHHPPHRFYGKICGG